MRHITTYIEHNIKLIEEFKETIAEIDLELVFESFNCTIMKEVGKQIDSIRAKRKAEKEEIESKTYEKYWMKPSVIDPPNKFKDLFFYKHVRWDKITDADVKEYSNDDKEGLKLAKRICSNRTNSVPGVILLASKGEEYKFSGLIYKTYWDITYISLLSKASNVSLKPTQVVDYLTDKYWVIELTNDLLSADLQKERYNAKSGMLNMGDANQYLEIAKANRERYKKLAEQKRMEKNADDGISDKVMDYVDKVLQICEKFSKDPVKYSSYEYSIQTLLEYIGDKQTYSSHGTSGSNGLMIVYYDYLSSKAKLATGKGSDSYKKEFEATKNKIYSIFEKIDKKISEIKLPE